MAENQDGEEGEEWLKRKKDKLLKIAGDYYVEGNLRSVRRLRKALEEEVEEDRAGRSVEEEEEEEEESNEGGKGGREGVVNEIKCLILFSLLTKPFHTLSSEVAEEVVLCVSLVLQCSIVEEWEMFVDLLTALCTCLTPHPSLPHVRDGEEDLKGHICGALSALTRAASPSVRVQAWGYNFRGRLGNAVYVCLSMVKKERSKRLRLQAFQTVQDLGWRKHWPSLSEVEKNTLRSTFLNFLPGIVQCVTRVATAGDVQGNRVVAAAIDTLGLLCEPGDGRHVHRAKTTSPGGRQDPRQPQGTPGQGGRAVPRPGGGGGGGGEGGGGGGEG
ncbi:uncharacterized protein LOC135096126 [Scylla paramamosain]|uniref:uncharacterized protein LOC135096126 n=1 Tax=Scylla paramamosain TaxID=85552 RepID=UPI003082DA10